MQEAQPQSVYFPNPDRTVVSDNPSLAGMSFSERPLKPFFVVKQLTDFTHYRLWVDETQKLVMFYRMAQSNSSENNFEFRQGISSRRSYFSLVYTVKTFLLLSLS